MNVATVSRDLSEQKASEAALRQLNEGLERRVEDQTFELADANKRLVAEKMERAQADLRFQKLQKELFHAARLTAAGQMAAALAHELNQPLTAVVNSVNAARWLLTRQDHAQTAVRGMKAGAADFLEKPYSDDALLGSIEAAFGRETDLDIADAVRRVATLSARERDVLDGLLAGRPNKLIAYDLGISVRTVEVHRARMMERLGVRQFAEAIRLGVMARLSAPPAAGKRQG